LRHNNFGTERIRNTGQYTDKILSMGIGICKPAYPLVRLAVGSRVQPGRSGSGLRWPGLGGRVPYVLTAVQRRCSGRLQLMTGTLSDAPVSGVGARAFFSSVRISSKACTNRLREK